MHYFLKGVFVVLLSLIFTHTLNANQALFNEQLIRIINQLDAIRPIIHEAERMQDKATSQTLHLKAFIGADNKPHNGVLEDVLLIKKGLVAYLNEPVIAPKSVSPIKGDFIESVKKG